MCTHPFAKNALTLHLAHSESQPERGPCRKPSGGGSGRYSLSQTALRLIGGRVVRGNIFPAIAAGRLEWGRLELPVLRILSTPFAILLDFVRKVVEVLEQEIQEFNNILYITS